MRKFAQFASVGASRYMFNECRWTPVVNLKEVKGYLCCDVAKWLINIMNSYITKNIQRRTVQSVIFAFTHKLR